MHNQQIKNEVRIPSNFFICTQISDYHLLLCKTTVVVSCNIFKIGNCSINTKKSKL